MSDRHTSHARRKESESPESGQRLCPRRRSGWRLFLLIVVMAWLGGLLVARSWRAAHRLSLVDPPETVSSLPMPLLKPSLDPEYRALLEEGQEACRHVAEAFPNDANAVAAVAMLHHLAHDKAGEKLCWQKCLELDTRYARAYEWLATRATDDGNYSEAETLMRQAMATGCERPEFPTFLGTALMQQGKLEEAASVLEADVRNNPPSASPRILLGQVYLQLGEYDKAKNQFEGALLLYPTSTQAYLGLVNACTKLGLADDAKKCQAEFNRLKACEEQAEREKQKGRQDELVAPHWLAEIMTIAGKVYLAHAKPEEAERHLSRAAELDPTDAECRESLSAIYDQQGRYADALRVVEELKTLEPENLAHQRNLGVLYGRLGQMEAAEAAFRELCALAPQEGVGYAGLAEIYLRSDRALAEAKALASKAVRLQPTAWNYMILASICEKDGDRAGAQEAMRQAAARDPGNPMFQATGDSIPEKP